MSFAKSKNITIVSADVIDFEKHYDSPLCLPYEPLNFENITWDGQPNRALIQGAGINEHGHLTGIDGILLEAEIEPISNEDCDHWINNSTSDQFVNRVVKHHLPKKLTKAILCALPVMNSVSTFFYKYSLQTSLRSVPLALWVHMGWFDHGVLY